MDYSVSTHKADGTLKTRQELNADRAASANKAAEQINDVRAATLAPYTSEFTGTATGTDGRDLSHDATISQPAVSGMSNSGAGYFTMEGRPGMKFNQDGSLYIGVGSDAAGGGWNPDYVGGIYVGAGADLSGIDPNTIAQINDARRKWNAINANSGSGLKPLDMITK